jgi:hypothetical protein
LGIFDELTGTNDYIKYKRKIMKKRIIGAVAIASLFVGCSTVPQKINLSIPTTSTTESSSEIVMNYKKCPDFGKSYVMENIRETEYIKGIKATFNKKGYEEELIEKGIYREGNKSTYSA